MESEYQHLVEYFYINQREKEISRDMAIFFCVWGTQVIVPNYLSILHLEYCDQVVQFSALDAEEVVDHKGAGSLVPPAPEHREDKVRKQVREISRSPLPG
jgi:hypothetical protein